MSCCSTTTAVLAASEQEHSIREGAAVFITAHVQGIRASGDIKPLAEHQHTCWPAIKSSSRFSSANGDRTKYIMDSRGGIGWVVRSADWCVHVMQTMLSVLCTGAAAKGSMRLTLRVLYNIEQAHEHGCFACGKITSCASCHDHQTHSVLGKGATCRALSCI